MKVKKKKVPGRPTKKSNSYLTFTSCNSCSRNLYGKLVTLPGPVN